MNPPPTPNASEHHRFPEESISHCVRLYFRFCLSYRGVEALMPVRGVELTYEPIRYRCRKFGQTSANQLRRRCPRSGYIRHKDEVFLTINKPYHYLWQAADQDGHTLDMFVQRPRDKKAAKKFTRKLLKGLIYVPWVMVTDRLMRYEAAKREVLLSVEHRQHRYLDNRPENFHQLTRQCGRRIQQFKSSWHAQGFRLYRWTFVSYVRLRRHRLSALTRQGGDDAI